MDARQLGSLNHSILEKTYAKLAEDDITIEPAHLETALKTLDTVADEIMVSAPQKLGFRESLVWKQEQEVLMSRLRALVKHDFTQLSEQLAKKGFGRSPRKPYQMETRFGIGAMGALIDIDDDLPPIYVAGIIDRIDRMGDDVLVLDYKTGSQSIGIEELKEGRNFQIMLYILATQGILQAKQDNEENPPTGIKGGYFLHIRNRKTSGHLVAIEPDDQLLIENARSMIAQYIKRAKAGNFSVAPSKMSSNRRCTSYCEFYKLCRIAITDREKPEPRL
jgi:ATP-dependent helicase/DNAse subunit B